MTVSGVVYVSPPSFELDRLAGLNPRIVSRLVVNQRIVTGLDEFVLSERDGHRTGGRESVAGIVCLGGHDRSLPLQLYLRLGYV